MCKSGLMLKISSQRAWERSGKRDRQPRNRCQTHQSEAKPDDSEVQSQVSKDGRIQQKDGAPQGEGEGALKRRDTFSRKTELGNKQKEDGIPHPAQRLCSKIQKRGSLPRALQGRSVKSHDRSVNDIAKQLTMTRERVMSTREV